MCVMLCAACVSIHLVSSFRQMSAELSSGAVLRAYNNENTTDEKPLVQVIEIKPVGQPAGSTAPAERFRLIISDGKYYQQAMLATQRNALVHSGQIKPLCIVRLTEFICNIVHERKILIVLNLDVVGAGPGSKIGNPQSVEHATANGVVTPGTVAPPTSAAAPMASNAYSSRPAYSSSNHGASAGEVGPLRTIADLTPYFTNWSIKARVTAKGDVRHWSNERGEGRLGTVNLLDNSGGEMRMIMFGDQVEQFHSKMEVGKVYLIGRASLKLVTNQRYATLNRYEISVNSGSVVREVGDDATIQQFHFDFVSIDKMQEMPAESTLDVCGVVKHVGDMSNITTKSNRQVNRRNITLMDDTNTAIDITLWGENAERYNEDALAHGAVLAIKQARLSDYGGRSLSSSFNSQVFLNELSEPRVAQLKQWYEENGSSAPVSSLTGSRSSAKDSPARLVASIVDEKLGFNDKPDFFNLRATVSFIKHDKERPPWYLACPIPDCKKKVTSDSGNTWHCSKCDKSYPNYEPRFMLSLILADGTGSQWCSAFTDTASVLLNNKNAAELEAMLHEDRLVEYEQVFQDATFKQYSVGCSAKMDVIGDEPRLRMVVRNIKPLNYASECTNLLSTIEQYTTMA
jgi:replication factor A1